MKNKIFLLIILAPVTVFGADGLQAADDTMNNMIDCIRQFVEGPWGRMLSIAAVILLGFGFAFSPGGSLVKKATGLVVGIILIINAISFGPALFASGPATVGTCPS